MSNDYFTRRMMIGTGAAIGAMAMAEASTLRAAANEMLVVGVIGPGGMGSNHLKSLVSYPDVRVAYVCEVDATRAATAAKTVETTTGAAPQVVADMRRVFDDKSIDAVFIATPDHWHAPATILACNAGKHVYVEKPCSHTIREGRLMIRAARENNRVVQVGTQSRSSAHVMRAMQLIRDGAIGDVLAARVWNSQRRRDIGHLQPSSPPPGLDYETWIGPAPMREYQANLLPGSWRWFYDFGCGDMGNDGVHNIDIAVWGLGVTAHPTYAAALGGKYFFNDDQQYPDTQCVTFEYDIEGKKRQLIFEQRIWAPYKQEAYENGNAFFGTKGTLVMGHTVGWTLYGERNKVVDQMTGSPDLPAHHRNFFDCVRSGARPNADVEIGHLSASLCHLGNTATRLKRTLAFDPVSELVVGDVEANSVMQGRYRDHWGTPKGV